MKPRRATQRFYRAAVVLGYHWVQIKQEVKAARHNLKAVVKTK